MVLENWTAVDSRKVEDELLRKYWDEVGGLVFAEVPVGRRSHSKVWPKGSRVRRIDGVRITDEQITGRQPDIVSFNGYDIEEFAKIVSDKDVEIIEIKNKLNRVVIGQVIVGSDMLELQFDVQTPSRTILCNITDPAMEIICEKRGIRVWTPGSVS